MIRQFASRQNRDPRGGKNGRDAQLHRGPMPNIHDGLGPDNNNYPQFTLTPNHSPRMPGRSGFQFGPGAAYGTFGMGGFASQNSPRMSMPAPNQQRRDPYAATRGGYTNISPDVSPTMLPRTWVS